MQRGARHRHHRRAIRRLPFSLPQGLHLYRLPALCTGRPPAGSFEVVVNDSEGRSGSLQVSTGQPLLLTVSPMATAVDCGSGTFSTATVTPANGDSFQRNGYLFEWTGANWGQCRQPVGRKLCSNSNGLARLHRGHRMLSPSLPSANCRSASTPRAFHATLPTGKSSGRFGDRCPQWRTTPCLGMVVMGKMGQTIIGIKKCWQLQCHRDRCARLFGRPPPQY
ncbi:MAG: hypothetical protein R2788_01610 [Saprospiraceae bacterium]